MEPFSHRRSKRIETITLLALLALLAVDYFSWVPVQKAFRRTHNTLGQSFLHQPTADLFLWAAFALIIYFGTRMWTVFAPHVFQLSAERSIVWRDRLQILRLTATILLLLLTLITIYRASYNLS